MEDSAGVKSSRLVGILRARLRKEAEAILEFQQMWDLVVYIAFPSRTLSIETPLLRSNS